MLRMSQTCCWNVQSPCKRYTLLFFRKRLFSNDVIYAYTKVLGDSDKLLDTVSFDKGIDVLLLHIHRTSQLTFVMPFVRISFSMRSD